MKPGSRISLSGLLGVLLIALAHQAPVHAQTQQSASEIYEIIVTAPRQRVEETTRGIAGASRVSMSYAVSYADLDLSRDDDREELEARVQEAAEEICELLVERYASRRASASACTRTALRDARAQLNAVLAAAAEP